MEHLRPLSTATRQRAADGDGDGVVRPKKVGRLAPGESSSDYVPPYVDPDVLGAEGDARKVRGHVGYLAHAGEVQGRRCGTAEGHVNNEARRHCVSERGGVRA